MEFKKTYSFRDRYEESRKIIKKYPDKILKKPKIKQFSGLRQKK